jgi:hypothetical protein
LFYAMAMGEVNLTLAVPSNFRASLITTTEFEE